MRNALPDLSVGWHLHAGESLAFLRSLPRASVDGLITDPPYSSGGAFRGDRAASTGTKYVSTSTIDKGVDFMGDTRDQRSWTMWCTLWISECARVLKPGAAIAMPIDWRQLPALTDAFQAGGLTWRGIAVWDKTDAERPTPGGFAAQSEYIVWGSNGAWDRKPVKGVFCGSGVYRYPSPRVRQHQTEKPVELMRDLVKIVEPGGVILDPFVGSGTTGVAAIREGYRFIGCEMSEHYADVARQRLSVEVPPPGFVTEQAALW